MPTPTAEIKRTNKPDSPQSSSMATGENAKYHQQYLDRNLLRKPDSYVYIFSVSKRDFASAHPLIRVGVRACAPDQRYRLVVKLPDPYQWPDIEQINGRVVAANDDARRIAQDYCFPANTSLDQDIRVPDANIFGIGNNLTKQGVFWVTEEDCTFAVDDKKHENPIPPEASIAKAEKRLNDYYAFLLEQARTLEISAPAQLQYEITQDHHMAAEAAGVQTSWHRAFERMIECPTCGEKKAGKKLIHKSEFGFCIDPSIEGWKLAVNSGLKTKDQVPEEFTWWKADPRAALKKFVDDDEK